MTEPTTTEKEPGQVLFECCPEDNRRTWRALSRDERWRWNKRALRHLEAAAVVKKLREERDKAVADSWHQGTRADEAEQRIRELRKSLNSAQLAQCDERERADRAVERIRVLRTERDRASKERIRATNELADVVRERNSLETENTDLHQKLYAERGELEDVRLCAEKAERERDALYNAGKEAGRAVGERLMRDCHRQLEALSSKNARLQSDLAAAKAEVERLREGATELARMWREQARSEMYGCCAVGDERHADALEALTTPPAPVERKDEE